MPKLYAWCNDPNCKTFQSMLLRLKVWMPDPTPQPDGERMYFDVPTGAGWTIRRYDRFRDMVRNWPKGH